MDKQNDNSARRVCSRCGNNTQLETHHIKHRANGGGNEPENLKSLCRACHDYQHAKEDILDHIQKNKERKQFYRLKIWQYRLHVLKELNEPETIQRQGYRSWWKDVKTHYMSREVKVFVPPQAQLALGIGGSPGLPLDSEAIKP